MSDLPDKYIDKIICGYVPDALQPIADGVFQTCITSPPYWGLRDYGLDAIVWDGDPDCEHEWEGHHQAPRGGKCTPCNAPNTGGNRAMQEMGSLRGGGIDSSFCHKCSAWQGSLGLEPTPELYINHLVQIFREVKRVLRDDGTFWVNIGDSYASTIKGTGGDNPQVEGGKKTILEAQKYGARRYSLSNGLKPKDMVLIPFRLALALQHDGWWIRSDIIWHKPNCMPSSVTDRPTTDFEHVFLLAKSKKYYYDQDAIREPYTEPLNRWGGDSIKEETPKHSKYLEMQNVGASSAMRAGRRIRPNGAGRNKRTTWTIPTQSFPGAHFATFPPKLIEPMILAGSAEGDIVLDCFAGSCTTLAVAKEHRRHWVGIEANAEYIKLGEKRIAEVQPQLKLGLTTKGGDE